MYRLDTILFLSFVILDNSLQQKLCYMYLSKYAS